MELWRTSDLELPHQVSNCYELNAARLPPFVETRYHSTNDSFVCVS